jgi:hypothetical protein
MQQQQTVVMDHDEKKMRRQIANSNERRRMQSINAGFQSLRQLLPHHDGEKLSKVSNKKINNVPVATISLGCGLWGGITLFDLSMCDDPGPTPHRASL